MPNRERTELSKVTPRRARMELVPREKMLGGWLIVVHGVLLGWETRNEFTTG